MTLQFSGAMEECAYHKDPAPRANGLHDYMPCSDQSKQSAQHMAFSGQVLNESFRDFSPKNRFNVDSMNIRSPKTEIKKHGRPPGAFLEMKTPAAWYYKQQKQNAIGISPKERLDDLCSRKPHDRSRGSSLDGSLFFTATPLPKLKGSSSRRSNQ